MFIVGKSINAKIDSRVIYYKVGETEEYIGGVINATLANKICELLNNYEKGLTKKVSSEKFKQLEIPGMEKVKS
jgi:hypothetical protein